MSYKKIPEAPMNELCQRTHNVEGRMETVLWRSDEKKKFNLDEPVGMIYAKRTMVFFHRLQDGGSVITWENTDSFYQ